MNTKILKLIATEKLGTMEIAKRLNVSAPAISNRKKKLVKEDLIFKIGNEHRCTPRGFKSLGMEVIFYGEEVKEIEPTETEKTNDRRMSILSYCSFEKYTTEEIARVLNTIKQSIYRDIRILRSRGYMEKMIVTDFGIKKLNSYDCNYGRGRIKATK